ncbi:MAG TPA: acyl-CoA dehydrogenase family protein, partial [Phenylobacterium sp.]|nr:acyl-CoA dehydrogenase family protein [Phenylobacterium sp.]
MADFGGEDLAAFRTEAKAWLEANFPEALKRDPAAQTAAAMGGKEGPDARLWRERMGAKGWGVPTWPAEYGGGGLSRAQARVLAEEMAQVGARNPIGGMGVMMFGPTLIEYGTEALKRQHLPGIIKGEVRWCQGYSEPGSGSDLASLQTRAEDKGDHYLVTGSKIWTSGANLADWCFCLVRTDTSKKHEGISFLLIDMKSPGVEVRPIRLINGTSPFCETFFTEVRVPKDQLFGPLNGGWTVAKRLLQFERDNISAGLGGGSIGAPVSALTVQQSAIDYVGLDESGRLADSDLRRRVTEHLMEARAFQMTVRRAADESRSGNGPSAATSIMKYAGAKIAQDRNELIVEALGANGLGWDGDGFKEPELAAVRTWL